MKIQIIRDSALKAAIWDGGKTYEYLIFPESAVYAERDFEFRISSASIEKTPSVFTRFNGYQRFLLMLDNDLNLVRNGVKEHYAKLEIFSFSSADEIVSSSLGQDFNLMLKNGSSAKLSVASQFEDISRFLFYFALEEVEVEVNQQKYMLLKKDLLFIKNDDGEEISLESPQSGICGSW